MSVWVTVALVACGSHRLQVHPLGIAPDYWVYSAVIAAQDTVVVVRDSTTAYQLCASSQPSCWVNMIPPEFHGAVPDYLSRNATPIELEPHFAPGVSAHLARDWEGPPVTACRDVPRITFSRVGFTPDKARAIVYYSLQVGRGPYPGCGYMTGALVGLRRTGDGRWIVERTFWLWET